MRQQAETVIRQDLGGENVIVRWDAAEPSALPACASIGIEWPGKARGKVFITARCRTKPTWAARLPAWVSLVGPVAIARASMPREHELGADDVEWREVELARFPEDAVSRPELIEGRVLKQAVQGGQPLRQAQLRSAYVVHRQQQVRVRVSTPQFSINSEGQAQNDAGEGERVRVRMASGQIIEGVARGGGIVEISP